MNLVYIVSVKTGRKAVDTEFPDLMSAERAAYAAVASGAWVKIQAQISAVKA